ncbi:MAG: 6-hydroxymethylpterin diphosphokinase MptE-like protein [Pseudomonadota bacterium]
MVGMLGGVSSKDLLKKNIKALAGIIGKAEASKLQYYKPKAYLTGSLAGGDLNVVLDGHVFYQEDAPQFSRQQVDTYLKKPHRLTLDPTTLHYDASQGGRLCHYLRKEFESISPYDSLEKSDFKGITSLLCVFGVGLGFHLERLVHTLDFRNMILYEPEIDLFVLSLHVVDYYLLIKTLKRRGGTIRFILNPDVNIASEFFVQSLRMDSYGLINGLLMYWHYPFKGHALFQKRFQEIKKSGMLAYDGWLEDETINFFNAVRNARHVNGWALSNHCNVQHKRAAFVIGNGPSLTQDIAHIRQLQDHVLVFSAGSALKTLLDNGIIPDFHCELENNEVTSTILGTIAKDYDLSSITLIASTCCSPNSFACFKKHVFFRRGANATIINFVNKSLDRIDAVAPSCTHTAMVAAHKMNCQDIYLFGVDLGTRDLKIHHAKGSIYENNYVPFKAYGSSEHKPNADYRVEANFGGEAYSSPLYITFRGFYELSIGEVTSQNSKLRVYNCSDGVKIGGAAPLFAKDIVLSPAKRPKSEVITELLSGFKYYKALELSDRHQTQKLVEYEQKLLQNLDKTVEQSNDIIDLHDRLFKFLPSLIHESKQKSDRDYIGASHYTMFVRVFHLAYSYWPYLDASSRSLFFQKICLSLQHFIKKEIPMTLLAFGYESNEVDVSLFNQLLGDGDIRKAIINYGHKVTSAYEKTLIDNISMHIDRHVSSLDHKKHLQMIEILQQNWAKIFDIIFQICPDDLLSFDGYFEYALDWSQMEQSLDQLHHVLMRDYQDKIQYIDLGVLLKYAGGCLIQNCYLEHALKYLDLHLQYWSLPYWGYTRPDDTRDDIFCQLTALKLFICYRLKRSKQADDCVRLLKKQMTKTWYSGLALSAWMRTSGKLHEARQLLSKAFSCYEQSKGNINKIRQQKIYYRLKREQALIENDFSCEQSYWTIMMPVEWMLDDIRMVAPYHHLSKKNKSRD